MTPANKLTHEELVRRSTGPKLKPLDKGYIQQWQAKVALGLPTWIPKMTDTAIASRASAKRERARRLADGRG